MLRKLLRHLQRMLDGTKKGGVYQNPAQPDKPPSPSKVQTETYQSAVRRIMDFDLVKSKYHAERVNRASTEGADAYVVTFYHRFQKDLAKRGMPFYAHEFYRDNARQYELKRNGNSKAGPGASPHNYGLAVDIIHTAKLWDLTEAEWDIIGAIGKETARKMNLKVRWGGDWDRDGIPVHSDPDENFWDPAHWEILNWRDVRDGGLIIPFEQTRGKKDWDFRKPRKAMVKKYRSENYPELPPF